MGHKAVHIFGRKLSDLIDGDQLLTNAAIAKAIGVTRETVSRWRTQNVVGINVEAFQRMAVFLKRDDRELLAQLGANGDVRILTIPTWIVRGLEMIAKKKRRTVNQDLASHVGSELNETTISRLKQEAADAVEALCAAGKHS